MSTLAIDAVWETTITTTVSTGVNDIYIWDAATLPIPASPTTYTVEGLRVVEVNPTKLIVGGATQSTSADQTLIAGGPQITLPSGKDWLPQTISLGNNSLGNSLYLGPRISTDTYPPRIEVTVTDTATAFPTLTAPTVTPAAETQVSVISSTISAPKLFVPLSQIPSTTSPSIATPSFSLLSTSSLPSSPLFFTDSAASFAISTPALITFTPNGPALSLPTTTPTTARFLLVGSNHSTGFATSSSTGIGGHIISPFEGAGVAAYGGDWSMGYVIASVVLGMGLRWRLWT
ncbi:hypothetical protein MMC11_001989 [Xylographa trunciseda]|nr:hypothetical protein [Xylographa trunciseda]